MAGAVAGFFSSLWPDEEKPFIAIAEPNKTDCIYRTAMAGDGKLHGVRGHMNTIMAGLACGEPCPIGWKVLQDYGDCFISMPDWLKTELKLDQESRILCFSTEGDTGKENYRRIVWDGLYSKLS